MSNSVEVGNSFRDAIYKVLKAAQKINCTTEKLINGKKVDIYFEQPDPLARKRINRIAVEAKYYNTPLTSTQYHDIHAEYSSIKGTPPAFEYLFIVTKEPPSSAVQERISANADWIRHYTFNELRSELMDFTRYLEGLIAEFKDKNLDKYYVPIRSTHGTDIQTDIEQWISNESCKPRAILAGYGMGKSSFAKNIASNFATKCINNESSRIPILIKLGDIGTSINIEALICDYFARRYVVNGFNYQLFKEFNSQGNFLILLDGFDEMKHGMSFHDFSYNINQFNSLVNGDSKIVILGRPNAFQSEDEKETLLHGIRRIGGEELRNISMIDYEEVEVSQFNESQLQAFLEKYIPQRAAQRNAHTEDKIEPDFISRRQSELLDLNFRELISRPVHAEMLVDIALSTRKQIDKMSVYALYHQFIALLLDREQQKGERKRVKAEARNEFQILIAWNLWIDGGKRILRIKDVSTSLLTKFSEIEEEFPDKDSFLREMIIGSILERKEDSLYFPHRSFQEYLVSEYILGSDWGISEIPLIASAINSEISTFIFESGKFDLMFEKAERALEYYRGPLSLSFLKFLSEKFKNEFLKYKNIDSLKDSWKKNLLNTPWLIGVISSSEINGSDEIISSTYEFLDSDVNRIFCLAMLTIASKRTHHQIPEPILEYLIIRLFEENLPFLIKASEEAVKNRPLAIKKEEYTDFLRLFCKSIAGFSTNNSSGGSIVFNVKSFMLEALEILRGHYEITSLDIALDDLNLSEKSYRISDLIEKSNEIDNAHEKSFRNFFRLMPNPDRLVPVMDKKELKPARKTLTISKNSQI